MPSHTRRRTLAAIGATVAGLAGCLSRGEPSGDLGRVDGRWPAAGRDAGHTRSVAEGPADPETVWTTDLEGARTAGTPSVADGRLYVPVDAVSDRARHSYRLHALEAAAGEERWRVPLRSEPNPSPAITRSGGRVVLAARRSLERGRIVGFHDEDGAEAWLYDVDARVTAPPTVDGVFVYVPDWKGRVHALSAYDGSVRWSRAVGPGDRTFARPVAVSDDAVYLGSSAGETGVVAVDAETGDERWSRSTGRVTAGPVVDDGLVVVRDGSLVSAFDADGTERWRYNVPPDDGRERPLALDDRHVYVPTRETLHAIERDGEQGWSYDLSGEGGGPPTVVGDEVLVLGDGELTALARVDGTERWSVETDASGEVVATPDAIVTSGPGGRVSALGTV